MPRKARKIEDGIQAKFLKNLEPVIRPEIFVGAIPNGGYRTLGDAVTLGRTGVKRGPTDLFFIAPRGVSAWLETKTEAKGSRLSPEQEGFRAICLRNGHLWGVYRTVEEGIDQCRAWGFLKDGM